MPEQGHTPTDFAAILAAKEQPLVVGGQAVNIWAELYSANVTGLAEFEPFVSKDADIYGSRALARELGLRAGWECRVDTGSDTITVAILTARNPTGGSPRVIEVLGEVNGLTAHDLTISSTVELSDGQHYRALSPLVLLKAKLYNLISLVGLERPQDLRHVRMLVELTPHFLKDQAAEVSAGRMPESQLLGAIRYLAELLRLPWVGNAVRAHSLDLRALFPAWLRDDCPESARAVIDAISFPDG